jgi:replicative DNA helicase
VIALSQLNRDIEQRKPPVPILSDLRDSGSLEQDADIVMFIYRGDIFEPNEAVGAQLLVSKQRNGPTDAVPLTFNQSFVRFEERIERRSMPGGLR